MTAVDNIGRVADNRWRDQAACRDWPQALWFPVLGDGGDNHGTRAKAVCAECPVNRPCLENALAANEQLGILGGAGESLRRVLHRAWLTDAPEGPVWRSAALRHFARLSGAKLAPTDANGPHATHGLAVSYSRGCRCPQCEIAASIRGAGAKRDRPWRWKAA